MDIEKVYKKLMTYSRFKFKNEEDRKDFVQDAIMKVIRTPSRLNFRNLYCDYFRENFINHRSKNRKAQEALYYTTQYKDSLYIVNENPCKNLMIAEARKQIKHKVELEIFDKILKGYSLKEISEERGCTIGYISQLLKNIISDLNKRCRK